MSANPTPIPPRFQVFVGFHTDVGRQRQKNEDAMLETGVPLGYLLAVADGMGGHDYGERAARLSLAGLQRVAADEKNGPRAVLVRGMSEANQAVYQESTRLGR